MIRAVSIGLLVSLVFAPAFLAQELVDRISSCKEFGRFGASVVSVDDFGGTGSRVLVAGDPGLSEVKVFVLAQSSVIAGCFGNELLSIQAENQNASFGYSVDCMNATIDNEARSFIVVGAPDAQSNDSEFVEVYCYGGSAPLHDGATPIVRVASPVSSRTLFGYDVAFVGDIDGDSYPDFAVGAPLEPHGSGSFQGTVRIYSGAPQPGGTTQEAPELLLAQRGPGRFGSVVALLGDLDGDQLPELLIGAPASGQAFVVRTLLTGEIESRVRMQLVHALPGATLPGRTAPSYCASVEDRDGDGRRDVAVQISGSIVMIYSTATGLPTGTFPVPEDGGEDLTIGDAGDYDGDGVPDLGIGVPKGACTDPSGIPLCNGGFYVISGSDGSVRSYLPGSLDTQGWALTCLGDLDGNGFPELAVGAPQLLEDANFAPTGGSGGGSVTIFAYKLTPQNHGMLFGSQRNSDFGWDVAGGFDIDGGFADVAVSAPRDDGAGQDAGRVDLFQGLTGAPIRSFTGLQAGDYLGFSILLMPDLDGRGKADLLASAPGFDLSASQADADAGAVYAFSSETGEVLYRVPEDGAGVPGSHLGVSIARAGFVDDDTIEDWIVGAPGCLHFRPSETCDQTGGYALVCSGADGSILGRLEQADAEEFGRYVGGEGLVPLLVGAEITSVPGLLVGAPRDAFQPRNTLSNSAGGNTEGLGAVFLYTWSTPSAPVFELLHAFRGAPLGLDGSGDGTPQFGINPMFVDLNGDGLDEVTVSAHESFGIEGGDPTRGGLWIYSGDGQDWSLTSSDPDGSYPYPAFAALGYSTARLRSTPAGQPDTLIYCDPASGQADVVGLVKSWNHPEVPSIYGFTDWDYYGYSMSASGDVDGDGVEDIIIGCPTDPGNEGNFRVKTGWNRAMIVLGTPSGAPRPTRARPRR